MLCRNHQALATPSKSLPIVSRRGVTLSAGDRKRAEKIAAELLTRQPRLSNTSFFDGFVETGMGTCGHIIIGDTSQIPRPVGITDFFLEYRLALLSPDEALVLIGRGRDRAYETYLKRVLGRKNIRFTDVDDGDYPGKRAVPIVCLKRQLSYQMLLDHAAKCGGATLIPHISTGAVWALAKKLAGDLHSKVSITGPPPRLSACVNNKIWFAGVVKKLLGRGAVPPERTAFSLAGLTSQIMSLSDEARRLVIKIPNSAGSRGNISINVNDIAGLRPKALAEYVSEKVTGAGWGLVFPVLVQVWEDNVLTSPSVQMWIPHPDDGVPVVEGLFEQKTAGDVGEFEGAVNASLPTALDRKLAHEGSLIATLFQQLGYYGRCSLDAVVTGADLKSTQVHWIECNGRWGGVSVPLTFMNQTECSEESYAVFQQAGLSFPPRQFSSVLKSCKELLWWPGSPCGIVISSPFRMSRGVGADFISIAASSDEAINLAEEFLEKLQDGSDQET